MKLVIFGLTLSSSWGNGHATLWRGLCRALARMGHQVVFFERDVPYYAAQRDLRELPGTDLVLYPDWDQTLPRARREVAEADAAMVTSYCPDALGATDLVLETEGPLRAGEVGHHRNFGGEIGPASLCYVVQPHPRGLCDAIFRAVPLIAPDDQVLVGLPDTVWFPADGFRRLPTEALSFLLFPVERPELFDAVVTDADGRVDEIQVKTRGARTSWIWGAFRMPGAVLRELHALWQERDGRDAYIGTLVNAWLERGGEAFGIRAGTSYVDVGTLGGYREAIQLLGSVPARGENDRSGDAVERAEQHVPLGLRNR